jgi:hypothetical protein
VFFYVFSGITAITTFTGSFYGNILQVNFTIALGMKNGVSLGHIVLENIGKENIQFKDCTQLAANYRFREERIRNMSEWGYIVDSEWQKQSAFPYRTVGRAGSTEWRQDDFTDILTALANEMEG